MIEFLKSKKMILLIALPLAVLFIFKIGFHARESAKETQQTPSGDLSMYSKIISNSSGMLSHKYPLRHLLSEESIGKIKFLDPQNLKENTKTVIIVLGDRPLDDVTPTIDMGYRVLKGVELFKKFPKSILIMTGGATKGPIPEAQMMGLIAWSRGIDPSRIILEDKSQTTIENAGNTAPMVGPKNIGQVLVVSEPSRLEEDTAIFQKHGEFKNIQGIGSDVTKALIIEQMEQYLKTHDDRVVRGRLHFVEKGIKSKAFKFAVIQAE